MRPLLKPGLRRVWRDEGTLQLGLDPENAVVIGGLDAAAGRFLQLLDGSRDEAALLTLAPVYGLDRDRAGRLLALLTAAGALDDAADDTAALWELTGHERDRLAPDLAALSLRRRTTDGGLPVFVRRRAALVEVRGAGRIGATLAGLLAATGVGSLRVLDPAPTRWADVSPGGLLPDDVGTPRQVAALAAVRRAAPTVTEAAPLARADLVVLAPVGPLAPSVPAALSAGGLAHLIVAVRESRGVVGPLVVPSVSSCLRCHDLHRRDRDPAWPRIAAQLATDGASVRGNRTSAGGNRTGGADESGEPILPCEAPLAMALAALAAAQVLAHLDAGIDAGGGINAGGGIGGVLGARTEPPATVNGTLELCLPDARPRRRSWHPHPLCGCGAFRPDGDEVAHSGEMARPDRVAVDDELTTGDAAGPNGAPAAAASATMVG